MSTFKRYDRYIVIKISDLSDKQADALTDVFMIGDIRTREAVVIEKDWPEYELVWKMIEDRMSGKPSEIDRLRGVLVALDRAFSKGSSVSEYCGPSQHYKMKHSFKLRADLDAANDALTNARAALADGQGVGK